MQIYINGEPRETDEQLTLATLVEQLSLEGQRFAIEVNRELVPRSDFSGHRLSAGDQVEVVQAIGGG